MATVGEAGVEFRLLGPVEVLREGVHVELGGPRSHALLGALLFRANETASVGYLVESVWDRPPASPETNLRTYVAGLRRQLGPEPDGTSRLVTRKGGYLLKVHAGELDLTIFEELISRAEAALAAGEPEAAADDFGRALSMWRGEPFEGQRPGPLLRAELSRLRERRMYAVERHARARIELGQHHTVIDELRRLVTQHPLREELWAQLMVALCRAGRRAEALDTHTEVRTRLAEQLGVEPGQRLRQLHAAMLRDDPDLSPPASKPPVQGLYPPSQLPADLATFTGRDTELAELLALRPSNHDSPFATVVISAIDGMAGIGKTALAVRAAHRLAPHFPDGQLFIDLHGHTQGIDPLDPAEALDRFLRALGISDDRIPHQLDARAALYRTHVAGRHMVIVLDNAHSETQVVPLLPGTPGCLVLVTSRRRLSGIDAQPLTLDVLPCPDAVALFTGIVGGTPERDTELVREIVELCGRLPLAIRIAAARLRARPAWTLAYFADRLRDQQHRLRELRAGDRSVAATFHLSYTQLVAAQQSLFRLLGLHPGPDIDARAAAALAGTTVDHAERLIEDLLDAHLLQQHRPGRYQFHDLIRFHATEIGTVEDPGPHRYDALGRLFDYYVHTAAAAVRMVYPHDADNRSQPDHPVPEFDDESHAVAWLDAELANLFAVAAHAASGEHPAHAVQLSTTLHRHLRTRGRYSEAEALYAHARDAARRVGDRFGELNALRGLGHVHRMRGGHEAAADCYRQALDIARQIGDQSGELNAMFLLGEIHRMRGEHEAAADCCRQALDIARQIGDRVGELGALWGLGSIHRVQGEYGPAGDKYRQALDIGRQIGHRIGEHDALWGLACVHHARGHHDLAIDCHQQALDIAREIGHRFGELRALAGLGDVHRSRSHYESAADCYHRVLELAHDMGHYNGQFEALRGLGQTHLAAGKPNQARSYHQQALDLAQSVAQSQDQVRAHDGLAKAHDALHESKQARQHREHALTILLDLGITQIEEVTADNIRAALRNQADLDD